MKRYFTISLLSFLIISCSSLEENPFPGVHKPDVIQGNVITDEMIDTLRPGLTQKQVRYIMGTPLISDSFDSDRWDYVYKKHNAEGVTEHQHISLYFSNDLLQRFESK